MEVISDKQTGETLLDEALRLMKGQQDIEKYSVNTWVDLMSGALPLLLIPVFRSLIHYHRRDVERDEDWVPAQASPRALAQGAR